MYSSCDVKTELHGTEALGFPESNPGTRSNLETTWHIKVLTVVDVEVVPQDGMQLIKAQAAIGDLWRQYRTAGVINVQNDSCLFLRLDILVIGGVIFRIRACILLNINSWISLSDFHIPI
jgi:hypothetical protein